MRSFSGLSNTVVLLLLSLIVIGTIVGWFFWKGNNQAIISPSILTDQLLPTASPTPVPFFELTIPYLRERKYESSLAPLEKVAESSEYESFLTSYNSDGLKINGQLTIPKSDIPTGGPASPDERASRGGWPAVVFVHGYIPPRNYKTLENYASYVDFLAKNGLVIFKIDLRGHGSSEGEPEGGYYSSDYIVDVLNARAALQASDFVNPEKIGLWGHSMAGNVIFRAFAARGDIPAVVIWAGAVYSYTDFEDYGISDNSYQPPPADSPSRKKRNELFEKYGAFDPENEFWKQVPGTNYLTGLNGAIQLNHAVNDEVVSIEYSKNLMKILDGTEITHELHEYSSGGHNISGASFNSAMQNTVDFFKEKLN